MGGLASGISLLQTIGMTIDFQSKLKGEEVAFGDKAVLALWILIGLEVISILAVYMTTNRVIKSKKLEMSEVQYSILKWNIILCDFLLEIISLSA